MVPFDFDPNVLDRLGPDALARCKKAFHDLPKDPDWKTLAMVMIQWAEGFRDLLQPIHPDVAEAVQQALNQEPIEEGVNYLHEIQRVLEMTILEGMMTEK